MWEQWLLTGISPRSSCQALRNRIGFYAIRKSVALRSNLKNKHPQSGHFMVSFLKIKIPFWIVAISILPQWVFGSGPVDRRIQTAVDSWVGTGKVAGVVVGLLSPEGQKIFSSGVVSKGSGAKPGPDTIFEVGSITKVFTTLLFMDEVGKGRMALNDPVSIYMPPGLSLPKRARSWRNFWKLPSLEEPVRLRHLALHTSGFPRTPSILDIPKDWSVSDPDYITTAMVEDFFNRFTFKRDPGVAYEYSVINTGLLGIAVCTREQKDYESLLIGRILEPMGLKDTRMELSREQSKRLAQGYGVKGQPVASIHMARETAGSGNLKSTARDLLKFISFSLGFQPC